MRSGAGNETTEGAPSPYPLPSAATVRSFEYRAVRLPEKVPLDDPVLARDNASNRFDAIIEDFLFPAGKPFDPEVLAHVQMELVQVLEIDAYVEVKAGLGGDVSDGMNRGVLASHVHAKRWELAPYFLESLIEPLNLYLARAHRPG
ncbi:MAG: hypothetical protein AABM32_09430 [Chloroflexota bacterium]